MQSLERLGKTLLHLVILLLLAGFALAAYLPYKATLQQQATNGLQQAADHYARLFSQRLEAVQLRLATAGVMLQSGSSLALLGDSRRLGFSRFGLVDSLGRITYSDGTTANASNAAWFVRARSGQSNVSEPSILNRAAGELTAIAAMPFDDQVLLGELDLRAWRALYQDLQYGESGYVFVLAADGTTIAHPDLSLILNQDNDLNKSDPEIAALIELERQMVRRERGGGHYQYFGHDRFLAFAPIVGTEWSLAAVVSSDELFGPAWRWRAQVLYAASVLLAIGLFFVLRSIRVARVMAISETTLRQVIDTVPIGLAVLDKRGRVLLANEALGKMYGLPSHVSVTGTGLIDLVPAMDRERIDAALARAFGSQGVVQEEFQGQLAGAAPFESLLAFSALPPGSVFGQAVIMAAVDVSAHNRQAELLLGSMERFNALFVTMPQGLILGEVLIGQGGSASSIRISDVNPSAAAMFGLRRGQDITEGLGTMSPIDGRPLLSMLAQVSRFGESMQIHQLTPDGIHFYDLFVYCYRHGHLAVVINDVSERARAAQEIHLLSTRDRLTGLSNRHAFDLAVQQLQQSDVAIGALHMDIDGLRIINKALGADAGDRVLRDVAHILQQLNQPEGVLARLGGDGFAMLLPGVSRQVLDARVQAIREQIAIHNQQPDLSVPVSLSIGIAYGEASAGVEELVRQAEDNLYREKLYREQSFRSSPIQVLNRALEARDFNTEGHSARLQSIVEMFAQELGLAETEVLDLRLLAQFHDVGKVGIPDRILFKPGKLSPEEWAVMQQHSQIGSQIAESSRDLLPIADLILKHHERWDGTGYPLGITAEEIPLACRILAIADAYDAMTNDRPYRRALSHSEASAEIERQSGRQFDPALVAKLLTPLAEWQRNETQFKA